MLWRDWITKLSAQPAIYFWLSAALVKVSRLLYRSCHTAHGQRFTCGIRQQMEGRDAICPLTSRAGVYAPCRAQAAPATLARALIDYARRSLH
jgi:hypothetical protein